MDVFRTENNCLKFHYDAEELWIQPWGANSFRIRATKLAEMPKENWALEMPVEDIVPKIQIEEKRASIINGKIKAVISSYGKLTIYNSKDEILLDEYLSFWFKSVCRFCMYIQYGLPESINRYLLQDMPRYNLTTLRLYTGTLACSVPSPVRYSQARTYSQL